MKTIIVLGDLNVDLIFSGLESAPAPGREILADNYRLKIGGSAANTACMLSRANCPVSFYGVVGNDFFGRWLIAEIEKYGIDSKTIRLENGRQTGVTVALTYPSDRMYMTNSGTVAAATMEDMPGSYLSRGKHLHLAAYFLQKKLKPSIGPLLHRAKMAGMTTSLDPGCDQDNEWDLSGLDPFWSDLDFFLPNADELHAMSGIDDTERSLASFPPPSAKCVVVKAGAQGAFLRNNGGIEKYPAADKTEAIDTSCAGDCFNAGFLLAINRGDSMADAVRLGNKFGATAVACVGLPEKLPT